MAGQAEAIRDVIKLFAAAGLRVPQVDAVDLGKAWLAVLGDLEPAQIRAAALAYMRDPKVCAFWPQPGQLLGYVAPPADDFSTRWAAAVQHVRDHALAYLYPSAGQAPPVGPWEGTPWAQPIREALAAVGGPRGLLSADGAELARLQATAREVYTGARIAAGPARKAVDGPRDSVSGSVRRAG